MAKKPEPAEPAEAEGTVLIRMRVSPQLFAYLSYLAKHTLLGASENDVAEHVLTRRLEEMLLADYHKKKIPHD
jgi:hypothetical protein